jgi:hypothetical protein
MIPFLNLKNVITPTLQQGIKFINSNSQSNKKEGFISNNNDLGTRSKQAISQTNQLLSNADVVTSQVQELANLQTQFKSLSEQYTSSNTTLNNSTSVFVAETNTIKHQQLNENKNVYVNTVLSKIPKDTYIGCYTDTNVRAMNGSSPLSGVYTTYDKCKQNAIDNGFQYFGLQDPQPNNIAQCFVSNDETAIKQFGVSTKTNLIKLWETNTSGTGNYLKVNPDGRFLVLDPNGSILFMSANNPEVCQWSGNVVPDTLNATYGGNCHATAGNATDKVKQLISSQHSSLGTKDSGMYSISASNSTFGDPAPGCVKNLSISYQCGNITKTGDVTEGKYLSIDCSPTYSACKIMFLMINQDGSICFRDRTSSVWCSPVPITTLYKNPDWNFQKNKYGTIALMNGQTLMKNEWMSSREGECQLIMQEDGNLVLYTSTQVPSCSIKDDKKMYGSSWVNAVYKLDNVGFPALINKIGYVDENAVLTEYPENMITKGTVYEKLANTDSMGNDINSESSVSLDDCKKKCNDNSDCISFVYTSSNSTCYPKKSPAYPNNKENIQTLQGADLYYTTTPTVINNNSCSKNVANIDSLEWNNYNKNNQTMTPQTECGLKKAISPEYQATEDIRQRLAVIADKIVNKIEQLSTLNVDMYNQMGIDKNVLVENLNKYKEISQSYHDYKTTGMRNIDGIIKDSNIVVLYKNYNYILWSILAIIIIIITIKIRFY